VVESPPGVSEPVPVKAGLFEVVDAFPIRTVVVRVIVEYMVVVLVISSGALVLVGSAVLSFRADPDQARVDLPASVPVVIMLEWPVG
jgi:hypothetical protein